MTSRTVRRRRFGAVAAVVALLALSACSDAAEGDGVASAGGEDSSADPAEAESPAPLDEDAQALVFAGCMRDNGVDMPDPGPGQDGLVDAFQAVSGDYDEATLNEAFSACEDVMPQYGQEAAHDEMDILDFAECLREQGLDVSDDPFTDMHSGEIDQNELDAAMVECRDVLTGGGR